MPRLDNAFLFRRQRLNFGKRSTPARNAPVNILCPKFLYKHFIVHQINRKVWTVENDHGQIFARRESQQACMDAINDAVRVGSW